MAQCVGTSATMAEGGTFAGQQAQIAAVATRLFGTTVAPQAVIGETLRQVTPEPAPADPLFVEKLRSRVQAATPPSAVCAPRPQPGAAPAGVLSRVWPGVRYGRAPPSQRAAARAFWGARTQRPAGRRALRLSLRQHRTALFPPPSRSGLQKSVSCPGCLSCFGIPPPSRSGLQKSLSCLGCLSCFGSPPSLPVGAPKELVVCF